MKFHKVSFILIKLLLLSWLFLLTLILLDIVSKFLICYTDYSLISQGYIYILLSYPGDYWFNYLILLVPSRFSILLVLKAYYDDIILLLSNNAYLILLSVVEPYPPPIDNFLFCLKSCPPALIVDIFVCFLFIRLLNFASFSSYWA